MVSKFSIETDSFANMTPVSIFVVICNARNMRDMPYIASCHPPALANQSINQSINHIKLTVFGWYGIRGGGRSSNEDTLPHHLHSEAPFEGEGEVRFAPA